MRTLFFRQFTTNLTNSVKHKMSDISAVDLRDMRKPYSVQKEFLLEDSLPTKDPIQLFHLWFQEVKTCGKFYEPNAVCLATSDKDGRPSARMVLLKGYGIDGFTIFTNYESRKGQEMTENPNVALLFYWDVLNRQVRIEGTAERVAEEESVEYFNSRPKASQLSARISQQSQTVESRDTLVERYRKEELMFPDKVTKPGFWGGFRIIPKVFEFWRGQTDRLHDRIQFFRVEANEKLDEKVMKAGAEGWAYQRLQP